MLSENFKRSEIQNGIFLELIFGAGIFFQFWWKA